MSRDTDRDRSLDIAVTGMSGRFPGAADIESWWPGLLAGRTLTTRFDRDDPAQQGLPPELVDDPGYVPVRGFLADADRFDHELFRISPREAELMDPQQRLMLEAAWSALEDACVGPSGGDATTAVYATASSSGYLRSMLVNGALDGYGVEEALRGNEPDYLATRIAYKLGLTGPAMTVLTACSSSLVAVHLAVQALNNGECDQALVVAASVEFPQAGHVHVPGGILSASGECRPFDQRSDGAVSGSGVVAVVLRRFDDAQRDGSPVHGVLLGTAVNNDGTAKAGYSAPSVTGQEEVIRAAVQVAGIGADSLGYLETHGTGTSVGDPIEWSAASAALRSLGAPPAGVAVGAVKANIGHLDAASGLASLVKALLVVREGLVPPVAGFTGPNPLLELEGSPLHVPTEAGPWQGPLPRRAGVSSFGIGGTNAHVVVEQPPDPVPADSPHGAGGAARLLLLSAADPDALDRSALRLAHRLASAGDEPAGPELADVARTLATGRAQLPHRLAVTAADAAEAAVRLTDRRRALRGRRPAAGAPPLVFLLPGQGTQYPGMALPFAAALPGFDRALDRCLTAFEPALSRRLRAALLDPAFPAAQLEATETTQPALFALEFAAATALSQLGAAPAALAGHSLGEITAACLSGVLDLGAAARFVTVRGRAVQACPPGSMLALACGPDEAAALLAEAGVELDLAAVNTPDSCVLAGPHRDVETFAGLLDGRVRVRRLRTSHAFHSGLVEPAARALRAEAEGLRLGRPTVPYASNADGRLIDAGEPVAAGTFAEQVRGTVRFADAMAAIARRFPGAVAVEVGPGQTLTGMAEAAGITAVPLSAARTDRLAEEVLRALGMLWAGGQPLDAAAIAGAGRPVRLPGYPFRGPRLLAPEAAPRATARRAAAAPVAAPVAIVPGRAHPRPTQDPGGFVTELWSELLGVPELSEQSDFFDLGADSLLATRLARRISERFGVPVPIRELLDRRSLGGQIALVEDLVGAAATAAAADGGRRRAS
jgi:phthiocerol/phenolphthiocerol synthesis type-I polyketide synthase E